MISANYEEIEFDLMALLARLEADAMSSVAHHETLARLDVAQAMAPVTMTASEALRLVKAVRELRKDSGLVPLPVSRETLPFGPTATMAARDFEAQLMERQKK